ncbi:MAG: alpha/beta hydrolase [Chitinophagaceae bacterium]|nr:alpha/beta hydrolase [Chitinophagaceae bacterium]
MKENTITYQSSSIFFRTTGKGKPIVLIHGFAEDGDIWKNQIEFLKEHFYPDHPRSARFRKIISYQPSVSSWH